MVVQSAIVNKRLSNTGSLLETSSTLINFFYLVSLVGACSRQVNHQGTSISPLCTAKENTNARTDHNTTRTEVLAGAQQSLYSVA